ncbi:hypothetical protein Tco_1145333 [Tanacetum coccineum]
MEATEVYKNMIKGNTWVLMGDWNVSLNVSDHSEGGACKTNDMLEFQECLKEIEVEDINWIGFMGKFSNARVVFLPHLTFDHCPALLEIPNAINKTKKLLDLPILLLISLNSSNFLRNIRTCLLRTKEWKVKLKEIQTKIDADPHNADLRNEEAMILKE